MLNSHPPNKFLLSIFNSFENMSIILECCDGRQWSVGDVLLNQSSLLAEIARAQGRPACPASSSVAADFPCVSSSSSTSTTSRYPLVIKVMEPSAACLLLMQICAAPDALLPPSGTPVATIAGASRLSDFLIMPEPAALTRASLLLSMETIRASGVANPYDAAACYALSYDLEMTFPRIFRRGESKAAFEQLYWTCVTNNLSILQLTKQMLGAAEYSRSLQPMINAFRIRHHGGIQ